MTISAGIFGTHKIEIQPKLPTKNTTPAFSPAHESVAVRGLHPQNPKTPLKYWERDEN
jgi:hypothetical protein